MQNWFLSCFLMATPLFLLGQECSADFTWVRSGLMTDFTDHSTSAPSDPIVSWFWDFDDNDATSTLKNPSHTFSESGKFNVELEITTESGCSDKIKYQISICELGIEYDLGNCNSSGNIAVTLTINDLFDSAESINLSLDGQLVEGGPFLISLQAPVMLTIDFPGDGLEHNITASSTEEEDCSTEIRFSVPDCGSDCFLSALDYDLGNGATHQVNIGDNFFSPKDLGVTIGDVVRFNWIDGGHSTTSDLSSGPDSWNSGILNAGSTFEVSIENPGTHRYYCIPHGGPGGVGMSGTILANCPTGEEIALMLSFQTTTANALGYNIYYDDVLISSEPFAYNGVGLQMQSISVFGDGNVHSIEVRDVSDPSCTITTSFSAPDCDQGGGEPQCSLILDTGIFSSCLAEETVELPLIVRSTNASSGFNLQIGSGESTFYSYSGPTTEVTVTLPGDGNQRTITITDSANSNCSDSQVVTTPQCNLPCSFTNLEAVLLDGSGESSVHIVSVEDFQFSPKELIISEGDRVRWEWTGQIPHSTTSDLTSGSDSWDSGVIGQGSSFTSPLLSVGAHPYYCIPHGGPGGQGMSGTINVLPLCNEFNEVPVQITFVASSNRGAFYHVFVDGIDQGRYDYVDGPQQEVVLSIAGDEQMHTVEIIDSDDELCHATSSITTPQCGPGQTNCELSIVINDINGCVNEAVTADISVISAGQSDSFDLILDGLKVGSYLYTGDKTNLSITVPGDGMTHIITVEDRGDNNCTASTEIIAIDCGVPCNIRDLEVEKVNAETQGQVHEVAVEDFAFNPKNIQIVEGDQVEWIWTGQVAHTTTSDATEGPDSWASSLLGNGASFLSPVLSTGEHPYYCVPHGGPGGVGMSGKITVLSDCNASNEILYRVHFNIEGKGTKGFSVIVDDQIANSFDYQEDESQQAIISLPGDGEVHTVVVQDNQRLECISLTSITSQPCDNNSCADVEGNFEASYSYANNDTFYTFVNQSQIDNAPYTIEWTINNEAQASTKDTLEVVLDETLYEVCLNLLIGECTISHCEMIDLRSACSAFSIDFTYEIAGGIVQFEDASTGVDSWFWGFGDGATSSDTSPAHRYDDPGSYTVCLLVQNSTSGCLSTKCENIEIISTSIDEEGEDLALLVYPNPLVRGGKLYLEGLKPYESDAPLQISIYDTKGVKRFEQLVTDYSTKTLDIDLSTGVYFLHFNSPLINSVKTLVVLGEF